jgi:hypothetical protein
MLEGTKPQEIRPAIERFSRCLAGGPWYPLTQVVGPVCCRFCGQCCDDHYDFDKQDNNFTTVVSGGDDTTVLVWDVCARRSAGDSPVGTILGRGVSSSPGMDAAGRRGAARGSNSAPSPYNDESTLSFLDGCGFSQFLRRAFAGRYLR